MKFEGKSPEKISDELMQELDQNGRVELGAFSTKRDRNNLSIEAEIAPRMNVEERKAFKDLVTVKNEELSSVEEDFNSLQKSKIETKERESGLESLLNELRRIGAEMADIQKEYLGDSYNNQAEEFVKYDLAQKKHYRIAGRITEALNQIQQEEKSEQKAEKNNESGENSEALSVKEKIPAKNDEGSLLERIQAIDEQIQLFIRDINHGNNKTAKEIQEQIDLADSSLSELESSENPRLAKSLENRKTILLGELKKQSEKEDKANLETVKKDIDNSEGKSEKDPENGTIQDQIANAQAGAENLAKTLEKKGFKANEENDKQKDENFSIGSAHMRAEQTLGNTKEDGERKESKEAETKNTFGELIARMRNNAGQYGEISENISEEIMDLNKEIDALDRKKALAEKDKEGLQELKNKREELVRKQKVSDGSLALNVSRIELMKIVAGEKGDVLKATLALRESFNIIKEGLQGKIDSEISKLPEPKKQIIKTIAEGETKIVIKKGAGTKSVTNEGPDRNPASFYKTESEKTRVVKNIKIKREALEALRKDNLDINDDLTAHTIIEIAEKCGKVIDKNQIQDINAENNRIIVNLLDNDKKSKLIIDLSKIDLYYKNTLAKKEAGWRKFIGGQKFGIAVILEKEAIEINDQNQTMVDSEETLERFQEPEIALGNDIEKSEEKTGTEEIEWINTEDMAKENQPQDANSNREPESIIETPTKIDTEKEVISMAFGKPIFKKEENGSLGIGSKIAKTGKKFYGETFDKQAPGSEKEMIGKISKDNAIKIENNFLEKDILRRFSIIWMNEHNLNQYSKENSVEKCLRAAAEENGGEGENKIFLDFIREAFKSDKANNEVPFVIARFEELAGKSASDFTIGEVLAIIEEVRNEKR